MDGIRWWKLGPLESGPLEHRGRHLTEDERPDGVAFGGILGCSIWMEGNEGENELNLQRTLLLGGNLPFLRELAGVGAEYEPVLAAREIGGAGSIDLGVLFRTRRGVARRRLVLVDCKDAKAHARKDLIDQCAQAFRLTQAACSNISMDPPLDPSEVSLVLLAGLAWGAGLPDEVVSMPRPGWSVGGSFMTIQAPLVHAYLPLRSEARPEPWLAVQELRPSGEEKDLWKAAWARTAREKNNASSRKTRRGHAQPGSASPLLHLPVSAPVHKAALAGRVAEGSEPLAIRRLLLDGRAGGSPAAGWRYAGETNDKGFVRLWWEREAGARLEALHTYLRSKGLDPGRLVGVKDPH